MKPKAPVFNTQGPKTTLEILTLMRYGSQGPSGDELWEIVRQNMGHDTFGDEINELYSQAMQTINQKQDNLTLEFKSRYWCNGDENMGAMLDALEQNPPTESSAKATVLLLLSTSTSPLGVKTKALLDNSQNINFSGLAQKKELNQDLGI